ncbi:hypothetical protein ACGK9U_14965 [Mariniflexile sp. HNIBRBA6329]|uniref:hypothetical protein n=1 Tax=Mariniflexile sp. HNIBRBA6329 TaxID=3373088 RepID=UPI00374709AD
MDIFVDTVGQKWKKELLWDNGWGKEFGLVRLPKLTANELWLLLTKSNVYENKRGAAEFLNEKHPFELKEFLIKLFHNKTKINRDLTKRLSYLGMLKTVTNRNKTDGMKYSKINSDYQEWKKLKIDFDNLKTESFWEKIKKL